MLEVFLLVILVVEFAQLNYIVNLKKDLEARMGLSRSHLEAIQKRISDESQKTREVLAYNEAMKDSANKLINEQLAVSAEIESLKKLTLTSAADIEDLKTAKETKRAKRKSRK
jgi:hypothetical protein